MSNENSKTISIEGKEYRLEVLSYQTDPLVMAVLFIDVETDEMYDCLTTNLGTNNGNDSVIGKGKSCVNEARKDFIKIIKDNKLGKVDMRFGEPARNYSGFNSYLIYEFDLDVLAQYDKTGVEKYKKTYDKNFERELKRFREYNWFDEYGEKTSFGKLFNDIEMLEQFDNEICFDRWDVFVFDDGLVNIYDEYLNELKYDRSIDKMKALEDMIYEGLDKYLEDELYKEIIEKDGNADSIKNSLNYLLNLATNYNVSVKEIENHYKTNLAIIEEYEEKLQNNIENGI